MTVCSERVPTYLSTETHQGSLNAFPEAQACFPGGVNSPVRAFGQVGGSPVFFERALGPYVWDVDGNQYLDYVGSWGPMILGHCDAQVVQALQAQAMQAMSFGAPTRLETTMAQQVQTMMPVMESLRFVSSGTEAVMSAVRLARAYTGRQKIVKFAGNYHGHMDALLIQAGSGASTLGIPNSAGVPEATVADTLSATFNDLASVEALFQTYPEDIAAVLVEPAAGNMGCIPPVEGFLEGLRTLTQAHGALLVFDEVMTGFRVARGGMVEHHGVTPDLVTLGKILGGGLPVGAYGGKAEVMACVAPLGRMYQAGTLSGNPCAMSTGLATLTQLTPAFYEALAQTTATLAEGLNKVFAKYGIPVAVQSICGMISVFFLTEAQVNAGYLTRPLAITHYGEAQATDIDRFKRFFWGMLHQGVYLPPSAYEAWFLSGLHQRSELDKTLEAVKHWCEQETTSH
ncbi:MAG: glutamate-1-semialdehyde 2,1-aminomutase [Vampirovibrionales bacterium]